MRTAFLRRNEKLDAVGEQEQAHFVVVSNRAEREETGDFGSKLAFGLRSAAKIPGSAHIDDQHHSELAFLREFFYEGAAHARRNVPIDRTNFISRLILSHIFKIHSASFENAVVIAGECGFDQTA